MLKSKRSVTPSSNNQRISESKMMKKTSASSMNSMDSTTHWNEIVQETVLSAADPDKLFFALSGGADEGQFPHIGDIFSLPEDAQVSVRGHGLQVGDVLLEIQGQKVSGFTGQDVFEVLRSCLMNGKMVVVRHVPKGKTMLILMNATSQGLVVQF